MDGLEVRGIYPVELELRQRGRELVGRFPYGRRSTAVVSDRGARRKEYFQARAFRFAVEAPEREIHLLIGHSFDRPLAAKLAGSLRLRDTAAALTFSATLPPEGAQPSWMVDVRRAIDADLVGGISPGFRVPPPDVVPDAEGLETEPETGVGVRVIREAVLYELSLVTRPAYVESAVDLRAGFADPETPPVDIPEALWRLR